MTDVVIQNQDSPIVTLVDSATGRPIIQIEQVVEEVVIQTDGIPGGGGFTTALVFQFDGGGADIEPGLKVDLPDLPFPCDFLRWSLVADGAGSAVVDVLSSNYANFPVMISITGTEKPTLTAVRKAQDTDLTSWSPIVQGDILRGEIISISAGIKRLALTVWVQRI